MARAVPCRTCGATIEIPDASERGRGRFPRFCSAPCKAVGQAGYRTKWRKANAWRYRKPRTLLDLMDEAQQ